MSDARTARKVNVADHIWQAFEDMAAQMGSERDALINQAMFMYARLNGFLDAPKGTGASGPVSVPPIELPPPPPVPPQEPLGQRVAGTMPQKVPHALSGGAGGLSKPPQAPPPHNRLDDDPVRREVAERVLETAAELERLIKVKNTGPNLVDDGPPVQNEFSSESSVPQPADGPALYLMTEAGDMERVAKDRFVIGRGKHCDFVINSGKVSREHAVIVREGNAFFIEDLGSSNGTWFNKQRIKRRRVEEGDEYFICSEKVRMVYR